MIDKRALLLALDAHKRTRRARQQAGQALTDVKRALNAELRVLRESLHDLTAGQLTLEKVDAFLRDHVIAERFRGKSGDSIRGNPGATHRIERAFIDDRGHLIFVRDDGRELDAGLLPVGKGKEQSLIRLRQKVPDTIVQAGSALLPVRTESANYSVQTTDNVILANAAGGDITVILPAAGSVFTTGQSQQFSVKKVNSSGGNVIVSAVSGLVENVAFVTLTGSLFPAICVVSDGTNYWIAL